MEEDEDRPPFWLQSTNHRNKHRGRSQISSILLNSSIFLIILLTIALAFLLVLIPTFIDFTSHMFRPNSIKKSWDSLNLVLVLFAIICGFLSRNINHNNEHNHNNAQQRRESPKPYPSTPRRWYDYNQSNSLSRLRSFRSYPDLRQESLWEEPRFYDDTHLRKYYPLPDPNPVHRDLDQYRPRQQEEDQDQEEEEQHRKVQELKHQVEDRIETKDIAVDTLVTKHSEVKAPPRPSQPPWAAETQKIVKRTHQDLGYERKSEREEIQVLDFPTESSPPSQPPPESRKVEKRRVTRSYKDAGNERKREWKEVQVKNFYTPPPRSTPPPPPPPPPSFVEHGKRRGKDIFNSIRGKKKKQRQKSVENLETFFVEPPPSTSHSVLTQRSPPPPPPPLPPPHFFQNLFSSKKGKAKKPTLPTRRANPSPPPPTQKHGAPVEESGPSNVVEAGGASPFRAIPPPPPPPPFKIPAWKFVIDGDYVRVGSFNSSRSESPDLESLDEFSSDKDSPVAAPATATVFCPSPDVDTKADNFIARIRAGMTLEKINSVKGRSNLGPGPSNFDGQGPS